MKNRVLFAFMLAVLAGCATELTNDVVEVLPVSDVFTATIENPDTKVFVDVDLKTHWNEGDEISIFTTTYNQHFKFDGQTGDDEGTFTELSNQFFTGGEIPTVYAVYPYNENTSVTSEGVITMNLPAVQNYAENSFGLGANTMVAATENKSSRALKFKSVCGYVVVRLYGEGTVKSITLTGNNCEKLAGQATVSPVYGQAPVVTMSESATTSITLDCGEGVVLGKTVEDATAFWFAVPPVTFSQGFVIKVTNTDLWGMEKTMKVERTVTRNVKNPLAPLEVNFDIPREGNIQFEDANFKAYCVENFDTNGDGELSYEEGMSIKSIGVNTDKISSMDEIKYFCNLEVLVACGTDGVYDELTHMYQNAGILTHLDVSKNKLLHYLNCCYNDKLTTLNASNNTALEYLYCYENNLNYLNVAGCYSLIQLRCDNNNLSTLNIESIAGLKALDCWDNQLVNIDLSNNTELRSIWCMGNHLTSLDVRNNTALTQLYCSHNQLSAVDVSHNTALIDLSCSHNQLSVLDVSNNTELSGLSCENNQLTTLDVSKNTELAGLYCGNNQLTTLDVSNNTELSGLSCGNNQLTALDVSKNTELEFLFCHNNQFTSLDVSNNTELISLECYSNQLTVLDVSNDTALTYLKCNNNPYLTEIWLLWGQNINDFQYDIDVATIKYRGVDDVVAFEDANFKAYCVENFDTNGDGEISYEEAATVTTIQCNGQFITSLAGIQYFTALTHLYCSDNQLTSLDVRDNTLLQYLDCQDNQLSALDISGCSSLSKVKCYSNQLTSLNTSGCSALKSLGCFDNKLTSLDVSEDTELKELFCDSNLLTSLDVSKNAALNSLTCNSNQLTTLDVSNNPTMGELSCKSNPQLTEIWLQRGQTIEHLQYDENVSTIKYRGVDDVVAFADANFKAYCVENFDTNGDGEISYEEAATITTIDCRQKNISSLEGIQYFTALTYLNCIENQLTTLDISDNTVLTKLYCHSNLLTALDVSNNTVLAELECSNNRLSSLDASNNLALTVLFCGYNQLKSLNISKNTALEDLTCCFNELTSLDVSKNTLLINLNCYSNQLTLLDIRNNTALVDLRCGSNQLTSIILSTNTALGWLECTSNQLNVLDVSYNNALWVLDCRYNLNLTEIWLKTGQTISDFQYDTDVATIYYK